MYISYFIFTLQMSLQIIAAVINGWGPLGAMSHPRYGSIAEICN